MGSPDILDNQQPILKNSDGSIHDRGDASLVRCFVRVNWTEPYIRCRFLVCPDDKAPIGILRR